MGSEHLESSRSGPPGPDSFPHTNLTFDVERRISIKALEVAMESGQEIFLVTQRELNTDRPGRRTFTPWAPFPG